MVIIFSYWFYFRKVKAASTHLQHITEVRCANIWVLCGVERHRSYPYQGEHARLWIPPQHHPWALVCLTAEQDFIGTREFQGFWQMKTTLQVFKKEHVDFSENKKKNHIKKLTDQFKWAWLVSSLPHCRCEWTAFSCSSVISALIPRRTWHTHSRWHCLYSPASCRYWKAPVRRSSELGSLFRAWVLSTGDGIWGADSGTGTSKLPSSWRYPLNNSCRRDKQFKCSWPQKTYKRVWKH